MKDKGCAHTPHSAHFSKSKLCCASTDEANTRHMLQTFVDNNPPPTTTIKALKRLKLEIHSHTKKHENKYTMPKKWVTVKTQSGIWWQYKG